MTERDTYTDVFIVPEKLKKRKTFTEEYEKPKESLCRQKLKAFTTNSYTVASLMMINLITFWVGQLLRLLDFRDELVEEHDFYLLIAFTTLLFLIDLILFVYIFGFKMMLKKK